MTRALIITADIGAGHDLPAELLADAIREREPGAYVAVVDGLQAAGRGAQALARNGMETILERAPQLYDAQYWLIARFGPTRRLAGVLAMAVAARGLLALIARERPDVIVSTYPGSTEVLGRLRRSGRVTVPCVSAVTDLAALRWWAHPGMDLHLITHAQSRAEVEAVTGPGADIRHVRGFTRTEFEAPPERSAARVALGLAVDLPVVVVSGGGWGVGDLECAARTALAIPNLTVVCLCGGNAKLRARLQRDFAGEPRVRVEGFTLRMCEWLAAADVLVHSTAGLTMLEAELCGTWAVSFGWGIGHIRVNNRAYESSGLASVATTPVELAAALREALSRPRVREEIGTPGCPPRPTRPWSSSVVRVSQQPADGASGAERQRAADHEQQPASDHPGARPVLAGKQWGEDDRYRGLKRKRSGRDTRRADALERAHLIREPDPRHGCGEHGPAKRRAEGAELQVVGQQLGRHARSRVGAARGDDQRPARKPGTGEPGQQSDQREAAEHRCENRGVSVHAFALRRGPRQQGQATGDGRDGGEVSPLHRLAEHPAAQPEQQHEAECERRLHDGQRRDRQRGHLQRPTRDRQRGRREPTRPSDEAPQQTRSDRALLQRPRLERLQGHSTVEARRRRGRERDPAGELGGAHGHTKR